jgi:diguanylate cyclase (GGDEF)-like protein
MPGPLQRSVASLLVLVASAIGSPAEAQERLAVERLPVNGALTQNTVTDMLQDRSGLMWFATLGGVNVYDGYQFRAFEADPRDPSSLSGVLVSELFEDRDGAIWIGGFHGWLDRFDPHTGKVMHLPRTLFGPADRPPLYGEVALWQAPGGEMWIGTGSGLHRYDPRDGALQLHADVHDGRAPLTQVRHLLADGEDRLWVGTGDGLYRLQPGTGALERFVSNPHDLRSLPGDIVTKLYLDRDGSLWVGTTTGLARRDSDGGFTRFVHDPADPHSLGGDWVMDIMQDSRGRLWIGSQIGGGLSLHLPQADGPGRFAVYRHDVNDPESLSVSDVWSLFEDRAGLIWIGTAGLGLNRINQSTHRFATLRSIPFNENSLRSSFVWDIQQAPEGEVWFSTLAGLSGFDPASGRFRHFEPTPGDREGNQLQALHLDRAGRFWVGSVDGHLYRFEPASGAFRVVRRAGRADSRFSDDRIWYLGDGPDGRLWLSLPDGLVALDPDSEQVVERIPADERMPLGLGTAMRASLVDSDGVLWFGGAGAGLVRYEQGRGVTAILSHDPADLASLSDNNVRSLHEDAQGTLWIGTQNGLNRMSAEDRRAARGRFRLYTRREGLPNNTIYGILPGRDGELWLSTNRGLSEFDVAAGTFRNYDVRDGLAGDENNGGAELRARDGTLYFGGVNGVSSFLPGSLPLNTEVPQVRISSVEVDGLTRNEGGVAPASLRLRHTEDQLLLSFAAMDFHQPSRNRFRWRIGNRAWVETERNFVNLTQLEPGQYRFEVQGSNNDGVWSQAPAAMDIVVDAPWWATRAAWTVYILAALAIAVLSDLSLRRKLGRQRKYNEALASAHSLAEANHQLALRYAQFDHLTQLPNRATLLDALGRCLRSARAQHGQVALLLINLDRFQRINDTIGHALGDNLLKVTAERLQAALDAGDLLARVGSDEFALVAAPSSVISLDDWLEDLVRRLQAAVAQEHPQLDSTQTLTAAIGIAVFDARDSGEQGPGDLLGQANIALHSAKRAGPGQVRRYQSGMIEKARERLDIESRMHRALEKDEFLPFYQPLVDAHTRRLAGFEALIRWQPPGAPMIFPDRFIPVAEESNLIVDLGNLMIRQVCAQLARWERWDIAVAVNVSMRQLRSGTLVDTIRAALAANGVPARCLKVEITESAMMENAEDTAEQLRAIKALGVRIAIDDFGTGFSSLSHLKMLPVDEMKIDRSFVGDLAGNKHSQTIVASIIRLAHELQLAVVAEGVEDESALLHLRGLGCDFAQGYYFDRPRPAAQIEERGWLAKDAPAVTVVSAAGG